MLNQLKQAYSSNRAKQMKALAEGNQKLYTHYGNLMDKAQAEIAKMTDEFEAVIIVCEIEAN
jgi:hypothetical protein